MVTIEQIHRAEMERHSKLWYPDHPQPPHGGGRFGAWTYLVRDAAFLTAAGLFIIGWWGAIAWAIWWVL